MTALMCADGCSGCSAECSACASGCSECPGCDAARLARARLGLRAAVAAVTIAVHAGRLSELAAVEEFISRMPPQLVEYWIHGEGAAKVRWCTKGSFERARRALLKEGVPAHMVDGTVANLYERACGHAPGQKKG